MLVLGLIRQNITINLKVISAVEGGCLCGPWKLSERIETYLAHMFALSDQNTLFATASVRCRSSYIRLDLQ